MGLELGKLLLKNGIIGATDFDALTKYYSHHPGYVPKGVVSLGISSAGDLAASIAKLSKCELVSQAELDELDRDWILEFDANLMASLEFVPLKAVRQTVWVAVADPLDKTHLRKIAFFLDRPIKAVVAPYQWIHAKLASLISDFHPEISPLERFMADHADVEVTEKDATKTEPSHFDFDAARSDENEFVDLAVNLPSDDEPSPSFDFSSLKPLDGDVTPAIEESLSVETPIEPPPVIDPTPTTRAAEAAISLIAQAPDPSLVALLNSVVFEASATQPMDLASLLTKTLGKTFNEAFFVKYAFEEGGQPRILLAAWAYGEVLDALPSSITELLPRVNHTEATQSIDGYWLISETDRLMIFHSNTEWSPAYAKSLFRIFRILETKMRVT